MRRGRPARPADPPGGRIRRPFPRPAAARILSALTGRAGAALARALRRPARLAAPMLLLLLLAAAPALAEPARILGAELTAARAHGPYAWLRPAPLTLTVTLDRAVPWAADFADGPARLVLDLAAACPAEAPAAPALACAAARDGTAQLTLTLPATARIDRAAMAVAGDGARLTVALVPVPAAVFAARAGAAAAPPPPAAPPGPPVIMIDPGHGGADPGALAQGVREGDIVLAAARDLAAALAARGLTPALTRDRDAFVPLESRMTLARAAGARALVSLHADALPAGQAAGAALYLWSETAGDPAGAQLALRHDRDDLLAGVDLGGEDDALAGALMALARTDTAPRAAALAETVAAGLRAGGFALHPRPINSARFAVLKAPDIPSVLVELGFLTDPGDFSRLTDPAWRARVAAALADAIAAWAVADAARTSARLR